MAPEPARTRVRSLPARAQAICGLLVLAAGAVAAWWDIAIEHTPALVLAARALAYLGAYTAADWISELVRDLWRLHQLRRR